MSEVRWEAYAANHWIAAQGRINKVFVLTQPDLYSKAIEDIHKTCITADSVRKIGWGDPLQGRMLKKQVGLKS
jgi:hypothetical protein